MDKTSPFIIVILTVLLGVMTFLYFTKGTVSQGAVPEGSPPGRMGQGPFGPKNQERAKQILKELNPTAEQESTINELRQRDKEAFKTKREAIETTRGKLEAAMDNPATSEEELKILFNEVAKVRSEMEAARFESMLTIRGLLTPEQRKKFTDLQGPLPGKRNKTLKGTGSGF